MPLEIAAFLGGMSVLIGALGVMLALGAGDERTEFDRVPRENCSDLLDPDRLDRELQAMVTARVASDEPLTAPLTGRPSVYYELEISVLQKHRSHNSDTGQYEERVSYEHYSRESDWAPGVRLEDASGQISLRAEGAEVVSGHGRVFSEEQVGRQLKLDRGQYRIVERVIRVGASVLARGRSRVLHDVPTFDCARGLITVQTLEELRSDQTFGAWLGWGLAALGAVGTLATLGATLKLF